MKTWTVEIRKLSDECPYYGCLTNTCMFHLNKSDDCTFEDCPIKITPENI